MIVPKQSHAKTLNFEDLSSDTRPPSSPTRATHLDIFGVGGRNNILARLSMVHDGLGVREKLIKAPVEDAGGDEGVDIADVVTADVSITPTELRSTLAGGKLFASKLLACGDREGKRLTGVDRPKTHQSCHRPLQRCC
jgi:hypothetical protein